MHIRIFTISVLAACGLAGAAHASTIVGRDATGIGLKVNAAGKALVTYHTGGRAFHVVAGGAINARNTSGVSQVKFKLDYSGRGFSGGTCGAYDGPPLAWMVKVCKAPDGSYWALQSWQRLLPNYGGTRAPWELHLSHWNGDVAVLDIHTDWAYGKFDHLFGSLTYKGYGVFGLSSTSAGNPNDSYGRNVYVDTLGSAYGSGWRRENSFLTHKPNGTFCYGFYPHGSRPVGKGTEYRATVIGPGVTPDVEWTGAAPGPFNATLDAGANALQRQTYAGAGGCSIQ